MASNKYPALKKSGRRKSKNKYFSRLFTKTIKYSALVALIIGIGYGGHQLYNYVTNLPYFEISSIWINGNQRLKHSQIRRLIDLDYQQNIFGVDAAAAVQAIEAHPYIKQAWVTKTFPGTVNIKVKERTRFALLNSDGLYVIDREGVVLEKFKGKKLPNLPIISGTFKEQLSPGKRCASAAIKHGLQVLCQLERTNLLRDVSEVNVQYPYNTVFYTVKDGIEVRLGEGGVEQKLSHMKTVWQSLNARIKEVDFLDLRYKDMVVVRFKQIKNMA